MSKPAIFPASPDDEVEPALLAVTDDWPRVLVEADLEGLARIVAGAETVFIEADGTFYDWPAYAARVARGGIEMVEYTHRSVRRLGPDAAVLTGRSVVERSGDGARHVFSVTDAFIRGTEGWRVVLGQMTPVAERGAPLPVKNPVAFRRGCTGPVAPTGAARGAGFDRRTGGTAMTRAPSRRDLLQTGVAASAAAAVLRTTSAGAVPASTAAPVGPHATPVTLTVNGSPRRLSIEPRASLLDVLRDDLAPTGTKVGCGQGQCGACTVHVDGRRVVSCLSLAVACEGKAITTIEGLARDGRLHPVQAAFIEHDAFQCGYCTPGRIMSGVACIREGHATSRANIQEYMSGNLCRCGASPNIVDALQAAARATGEG